MIKRAIGDNQKQSRLMNHVHTTNKTEQIMVNHKALFAEITPEGISLIAVLGFLESNCRSEYRLKAIAAERANTIHKITNPNFKAISDRGM